MESTHRPGRPADASITVAILRAARAVMETDGYSKLSVDSLVRLVGTTRPTFYRRFPSTAHLAFEVIGSSFGGGDSIDTGTLEGDLLALQREDLVMFDSALMRKNLPGLLETIRVDASVRERYQDGFVGARRENVRRVLEAAAKRGEVDQHQVDLDLICDFLVGPLLSRAILPISAPLDDNLAHATVATALFLIRSGPGRRA